MPSKTFTIAAKDDPDPVSFTLVVGKDRHTFHGAPKSPFIHLLRFGLAEHTGDEALGAAAMVEFVNGVIVEEEKEQFQKVLSSTAGGYIVDDDDFREIFKWLVETYARRPTQPSSGSSSPQPSPGPTTDPAWNPPQQVPILSLTPVTG